MPLFAFSAELPFTALLNKLFGGVANSILEAVGQHAADPKHPIPNWMAMQILTVLLLIGLFALIRSRLSVERPGALQQIAEIGHEFISINIAKELIGHHYERYVPFMFAIFTFILTANLIGLVPFFESPTANPAVPLGCAVATFLYYHAHGIRQQGLAHYVMHFFGPQDKETPLFVRIPISLLLFPIEIISHSARLLSLTVRLFANMFAGEMLTLAFFSLIPLVVPVMFLGLHLLVAFIQAYVFVLLTAVYLSGAVGEEH